MHTTTAREVAASLIVIADQGDRDAWLEGRRGGLGGSDISAIVLENPHKKPIEVYDSIVHPDWQETRSIDPDRLVMGQFWEPRIIEGLYIHGAAGSPGWPRPGGPQTVWRPPLVARKGREWQRGSCDGLVLDNGVAEYIADCNAFPNLLPPSGEFWDEFLEIKTHGYQGSLAYSKDPFDEEPVPPDKIIQTSWYGDIWGIGKANIAAVIDTHLRRHWSLQVSAAFVADLIQMGEDFWTKNVLARVAPDPDGSEGWNRHLRHKYRASIGGTVVKAGPELDAIVSDLRAAWLASKAADKRLEVVTQIVKDAMGTHERMDTHLGAISWKTRAGGNLSWRAALDAVYQALAWGADKIAQHEAAHTGEPSRTFTVPHAKWKKT